jgi:4-hydroxybenzoate polyprenyltransferase
MSDRPGFVRRWWIYQRERFPLLGHGPLIAAFSFCAVSYSYLLRSHAAPHVQAVPLFDWASVIVAFVTCLLFFLQLRIADEFKDFEEDSTYRPYRAVPRGLVTLRELGVLFVLCALVQLGLAIWLDWRLAVILLGVWIYLAAMSKEFFVADWLKERPLLYMVSHMVIMPLVDLYATSTDWLIQLGRPPGGLWWFLLASFFNGMVIEIGRKIRSPADEERGVRTYSAVWGMTRASMAQALVMLLTGICATLAALRVGNMIAPAIFGAMFVVGVGLLVWFGCSPAPGRGKKIEVFSGIWTIVLYLALGALPLLG